MSVLIVIPSLYPDLFDGRYDVSIGNGWFSAVNRMCARLSLLEEPPKIVQIKEKFGLLRCYIGGSASDSVKSIIRSAEQECAQTCDVCGKPGSLRNINFLVATRCDEHNRLR